MPKKRLSRVHFTSKSQDWGTPQEFFDLYDRAFRFTRDVCAEPGNAKLARYWSKEDDAFSFHWGPDERNWMNPEYKHAAEWTRKARVEAIHYGALTVGLVPARTSEAWWTDYVQAGEGKLLGSSYCQATRFFSLNWQLLSVHIQFVDHRIKFEKPGKTWQAPFPSAVVVWEPAGDTTGLVAIRRLAMKLA